MLTICPINDRESLRSFYPLIAEACERLTEREGREHFAPDVYLALTNGTAKGYVVLDGKQAHGFFAVQPTTDASDRPALQVWLAYARPGVPGVIEAGLRECELLAQEQGRDTLILGTQRRGWLRRAPQLGFELREFIFEKRVTP